MLPAPRQLVIGWGVSRVPAETFKPSRLFSWNQKCFETTSPVTVEVTLSSLGTPHRINQLLPNIGPPLNETYRLLASRFNPPSPHPGFLDRVTHLDMSSFISSSMSCIVSGRRAIPVSGSRSTRRPEMRERNAKMANARRADVACIYKIKGRTEAH